jgi:hypothetical protein
MADYRSASEGISPGQDGVGRNYHLSFSAAALSFTRSLPTRLISARAWSAVMPCFRAK